MSIYERFGFSLVCWLSKHHVLTVMTDASLRLSPASCVPEPSPGPSGLLVFSLRIQVHKSGILRDTMTGWARVSLIFAATYRSNCISHSGRADAEKSWVHLWLLNGGSGQGETHNITCLQKKNGVFLLPHSEDEFAFYYKTTGKKEPHKNV